MEKDNNKKFQEGLDKKEIKFCKTHNKVYFDKINQEKKEDQHINCDICLINNIEEEKRNILKENINFLENILENIERKTKEFKIIIDKNNEYKETVKTKIQKIFTKIRSTLNEREDGLLLEVDKMYDDLYFNKDLIKEEEQLSNKVKKSLEKGKLIDNKWGKDENNNLYTIINDCLNIEDSIKEINVVNKNLNNLNPKNLELKFIPSENEIGYFSNEILKFGKLSFNKYIFKRCPINISKERKYNVSGEKDNIITKTGTDDYWMGSICEKQLDQSKEEHSWKIKILRTYNHNIMIGVATIDFDINSSSFEINKNKGWYYYCINGTLYSGPPDYYQGKRINLNLKDDEITVIMNMKKRTLKFIINREDKGELFTNIPLDKPIFPSILLKDIYDSVEIIES